MYAEERKQAIIDLMKKRKKITVLELSEYFSSSPGTIRNDLQALENRGLLKRTHGGAMSPDQISFEHKAVEKEVLHLAEKKAIAKLALTMIYDGDTIALDTGTTTMELAKLLAVKKNLIVVTNDLEIALELEKQENTTVIMIGGTVRRNFHCTFGAQSMAALSEIRVDKTFIAANGVSIENGITTPNIDTAEVKRELVRISGETILLCDSSKIGRISFMRIAELSDMNILITDQHITPEQEKSLRESGVDVKVAE